ncbi:hypothetical protein DFP72DRAFT_1178138 [Ephemerocybe angulata]|uniref:Uncharacterized protein n=1 Tax=Ephemerocybe angulata TaxID=980116 RepID=A0A8H6HCK3_9AGAR|nr:hypothetical protein DFP72DRAFT_1178138 [Tulosesus angulatus]
MSLSPKDLSTLTTVVSTTKTQDIPAVWPQRWGTGKILFLLTRYLPILLTIQAALAELPVRTTIPPKACEGLWKGLDATTKAGIAFSEITLLVCLHALLGAKRRYLACMILVYIGLTLGVYIPQLDYIREASRAVPLGELDHELGYACTWKGQVSASAIRGKGLAAYVSLATGIYTSTLALVVFYVRYRHQAGSLINIIRRDSGVYIFALTGIRLGNTVIAAFRLRLGRNNMPSAIFSYLSRVIVPLLASRLLLNMRTTKDLGLRTYVSTILFDSVPGTLGSLEDDQTTIGSIKMARVAGIGRRRGLNKANEDLEQSDVQVDVDSGKRA